MCWLLDVALSNALAAAVLAVLVVVLAKFCRRPNVIYCLWVIVLLKLVTPPLFNIEVPVPAAADAGAGTVNEDQPDLGDQRQAGVKAPDVPTPNATPSAEPPQVQVPQPDAPRALTVPQRATSARQRGSGPSWRVAVGSLWLAGAGVWFAVVTVRVRRFRRELERAPLAPEPLRKRAERIAASIGLRRRFVIRIAEGCVPPLLWAMGRRPAILLPGELLGRLDTEQQNTLLAHELAHLRRRDHWVRWLELIVVGIYWWHPAAWYARRQLQQLEEQCCDAWVLAAMPSRARTYAAALMKTLDFLSESRPATPVVASGFARLHVLQRRFAMILHDRPEHRLPWSRRLALSVVGTLVLVISPQAVSTIAGEEAAPASEGARAAESEGGQPEPLSASLLTRTKSPYPIPKQSLRIPKELKACDDNLHEIYAALMKYERDKGDVPEWLSDLVPDYLEAETLLCEDDAEHTSSYWPDPKLPCSYCYELSPSRLRGRAPLDRTMREYKVLQRGLFGDVVPIVRCFHHDRVINLAWDGRVYTSAVYFERLFIPNYRHEMLLTVEGREPPRGAGVPDASQSMTEKGDLLAFDDFDGELGLRWNILKANPSGFSLKKKPGALTITTKNGHFSKSYTNYENLFLIDAPRTEDGNFQITAKISSFHPAAKWNQAGIVCWDDEDNYVKLVYEWISIPGFHSGTSITAGLETGGQDGYRFDPAPTGLDAVWLRITKRENSFECSWSTDGKSFRVCAPIPWNRESPKQVGLFANNGSTQDSSVPSLDASFELFQVARVGRSVAAREPRAGEVAAPSEPRSR